MKTVNENPHFNLMKILEHRQGIAIWFRETELQRWKRTYNPDFNPMYKFTGTEFGEDPNIKFTKFGKIKFQNPEVNKPEIGTNYWIAMVDSPNKEDVNFGIVWRDDEFDNKFLQDGLLHLSHENATKHSEALNTFNLNLFRKK